jgi:hypothetical protein
MKKLGFEGNLFLKAPRASAEIKTEIAPLTAPALVSSQH